MRERLRKYTAICAACVICACASTCYVWRHNPVSIRPWSSVVGLALFAALAELLAVNVSHAAGKRTSILPTSPVQWATTGILGPFWAVVVCVAGAVGGHVAAGASYCIVRGATGQNPHDYLQAVGPDGASWSAETDRRRRVLVALATIGISWQVQGILFVVGGIALHVATVVLSTSLSGLAYYSIGGAFLVQSSDQHQWLSDLVVPFLGLVAVSIVLEHGIYVIVMAGIDPVPGVGRMYAFFLRCKMALIEDVLPVWKGEIFLVVVALLLSFLYVHIGVWGFLLAVMPVLALRDFFNQWVQEKSAYMDTITTLATYMQHYHPYTRGHLKRVADLSERLARELRLPAESIIHMRTAGFLHDIGKVGVSEEILDKTGKLTDDEWGQIKEHPVKGAEIISHLEFLDSIINWVKYHHKWHNGAGYPVNGDDGSGIPVEAAIIAVADAFDAMTDDRELSLIWKCDSCGYQPQDSSRPVKCPMCGAEKRRTYNEPKSLDDAIEELRRGAGSQFHPGVVKAFLTMVARDGVTANG